MSDTLAREVPHHVAAMPPLRPHGSVLMEGFRRQRIRTEGAEIEVAVAGEGPPLLLLHGNPLTLVSWHKIAPTLAESFTVVAADLRGYGDSSKPELGPAGYTFRVMGEDNFSVMSALGFERFAVCGHDRGARVAFRMALDRPERVTRNDGPRHRADPPCADACLARLGARILPLALHGPEGAFPEKLLSSDLDYYMRYKLSKKGIGLDIFTPEAMAEYIRCATPEQIHAVCEDYRATVTHDFEMDTADYGKRRIECPVLALWGSNSHVGRHYKPLEAWAEWASDLRGWAVPTGHYPAEQRPDLVYRALWTFFTGAEPEPYRED